MKKLAFIAILLVLQIAKGTAQTQKTASQIFADIQKLNTVGTVLFVAAHPDDENTRMISYLSNEKHLDITYLSLTRGDGGQNLIGSEIRELLGIIRTQELLAARRVDGGKQLFSRANDFGYSKHPDETLNIWNKAEVLEDVVWTIRKLQPDVVINRFNHRTPGTTHGHHTSSAMLSVEAFNMAGNPRLFPEQLEVVSPWTPTRLFLNTSWWFYGSRENFAKADKTNLCSVDVGTYYPLLGKSNTEIAAESRSMHKCQGMGRTPSRGTTTEWLELLEGSLPEDKNNPFEGIDMSWNRVKGGKRIGERLGSILKNYDLMAPEKSVPALLEVHDMISMMPENKWKSKKLEDIKEIIRQAMGLYIDVIMESPYSSPGQEQALDIEVINRSSINSRLVKIEYLPMGKDTMINAVLEENQVYNLSKLIQIPSDMEYTSPYWLNDTPELGMYKVPDLLLRGLPETPRALKARFLFEIQGTYVAFEKALEYKYTDNVKGEIYQPFEILPEAFVKIEESAFIFGNQDPKPMTVTVKAGVDNLKGTLKLKLPEGWSTSPETYDVELGRKGQSQTLEFMLHPSKEAAEIEISAYLESNGKVYDRSLTLIEYDHIPTQSILLPASSKAVKIDLKINGNKIAYIMGAGDEVPVSLEQIGYNVDIIDPSTPLKSLVEYDALILGIRAYNTIEELKFINETLFDYVKQGGTMIVQYTTTWGLKMSKDEIPPLPLTISRKRVSDENAEIRVLAEHHPVMNTPNKLNAGDFSNWVQERGLYFPNEWSEDYTAILSCNDKGEEPLNGGLLIAELGKGYYVYTGLSFFRELPAGVPGAYRLFANMISLGKN
jgi:LmbE family N-acetylglucosaminyl deacetylase